MSLPAKYRWLAAEPAPKILVEALKSHGVKEVPGKGDAPEIMEMARVAGLAKVYTHDSIAWCGLAVAYWAVQAGYLPAKDPLWARNWQHWGSPADKPSLGDVMVFERGGSGHVAIYVGEDATHWHILGGNQSDQVNIVRRRKSKTPGERLIAARRSPFKIGQPVSVRPIRLTGVGTPTSASEA